MTLTSFADARSAAPAGAFSWADAVTGENDPGCRAGMVWEESRWSAALLVRLRELAARRAATAALRRGTQQVRAIDPDTVLLMRTHGDAATAAIVHRGTGITLDPAHPALSRFLTGPLRLGPSGTAILDAV